MRPKKRVLICAESELAIGHLILPLRVGRLAIEVALSQAQAKRILASRQQDAVIVWEPSGGSREVYNAAKARDAHVLMVCKSYCESTERNDLYDRLIVNPSMTELLETLRNLLARKREPKLRPPVPSAAGTLQTQEARLG